MKRVLVAVVAACSLLVAHAEDIGMTYDANGDVTVAAGGEITVGPNGASTNNSQGVTVTFENGGTIKAIPTDSAGSTITAYHRLWREYFINGTVTYDGSDIPAGIAPEFRRSIIATNGTLVISADRSSFLFGSSDSARKRHYPLFDVSNLVFAAGSGTISSMAPSLSRSGAVILSASAASGAFVPSRQRMPAQPSGEITE